MIKGETEGGIVQAAVYRGRDQIYLEEWPTPTPGAGELLVRVRSCGLCGSDILKIVEGKLPPPAVLGHEVSGDVVAVGEGVTAFHPGDRVVVAHHVPCYTCHYCRHGNFSMCRFFKTTNLDPGGFAQFVRVPGPHVHLTTFPLPSALSYDEGTFMEPLACCLRSLKRCALQGGDLVVIVGSGSIGLLMMQLVRLFQAQPVVVDLVPERLRLAQDLGAYQTLQAGTDPITAVLQELSEGRGADLIIFTAGQEEVVVEALTWVRDGGTINLFAGLPPARLDLRTLYHRELTVYGSYSPSPRELSQALTLLAAGKVQVKPLITHHLPLAELPQAVVLARQRRALKVMLHP
ncbi:MAG: alcohol dehydrogenase [Nitrospinota bacterium]|nr:MAG: alcohol dehydrogenase [Nitrospinota bacterium]